MRVRAESDRGSERLAGEHMRAVELAGDHAIEQHLPVRLRLERHEQTFVFEIAELVGNRERRHVRELDEAELELVLLERERLGLRARDPKRADDRSKTLAAATASDWVPFNALLMQLHPSCPFVGP